MYKNSKFFVYLCRLVYPNYDPYCFVIYMFDKYLDVQKQQQIFSLKIVSNNQLKQIVTDESVWDINNTVVVNNQIPENCVKFIINANKSNREITKRKVNVITKNIDEGFVALIGENLAHNLNWIENCRFRNCEEKSLKFADEIELALINTSNEWSHFAIDVCLKNYFQLPKLLYKNDVIQIDLEEYGPEVFFSNKIANIDESMFFKCNKITSGGCEVNGGYLCAMNKTSLKQTQNVQSFIPKIHQNCLPSAFNDYFELIARAVDPFVTNKYKSNFLPIFLLEGRKGSGKSLLVENIASRFGMHLYSVSNFDICANVYAQNESKLRNVMFTAKMASPTVLQIKNFENFGKNLDGQYDDRLIDNFKTEVENLFKSNAFPLVVFCCSNEKSVPNELKRVFLKIFEIKAPNVEEREKILEWVLGIEGVETDADLSRIANRTHGFLFEDLRALTHRAITEFFSVNISGHLPETHLQDAVEFMQANYSRSLGAPEVPRVKWSDIGGLNDIKEEIISTIELPLKHPDFLKTSGLKRSGILLYGPPGTGKTLIAKAVASECALCFLSVKGPELLNMYVGQSEQNVREVFERAREASPCIIFFDELDSLAPNRGHSGDSGGVMDRVVSQLLAEMDGLERNGTVFVIGATNRPDLVDPALLRPGRFDKLLYVGPCIDRASKISVLEALTKKFQLQDSSVIENVVDLCPENFSGADFYGVCSNAWMGAVRRTIRGLEEGKEGATGDDVVVTVEDFAEAVKNTIPSIKQQDLAYFYKLKSEFT